MNYPFETCSVLLIEDNHEYRNVLQQLLSSFKTNLADIIEADNIIEAEKILKSNQPGIIFISAQILNNASERFIYLFKELNVHVPLIILLNKNEDHFTLKSLSIVADDYLYRNELSAPLLSKSIEYNIEKKKNKEDLKEAIERYNLFTKATNDIAWDWEITKRSAYWVGNGIQNFLKFPGTEMFVETNFWENHLHPEDKDRVMDKLQKVFTEAIASNWEDEYRLKNKEGEYRHIYDRGFIIYKNNVPVRMLGSMVDITAKYLLEKELEIENNLKQQQITEAVITAQEKERSEIGKELHDNVNQMLSASRLYIDAANNDDKNRLFLLSQASSFIKNSIEEIRTLSKVLHTPLINELGLIESIDNLADEMMAVNELDISMLVDNFDEGKFNYNFKLTIYRIVQEQITNILKRAKASIVNINITNNETEISVEIKDDGIGFDTKRKRTGIGISNILSRVNMYNGILKLESVPEKGSSLCVTFPINETQLLESEAAIIINKDLLNVGS